MLPMKLFAALILSTLAVVACTQAAPRLVAPGPSLDAFGQMDADHDGALSPAEFARGMADMAKPDEARRLFTRLDLDHDGLLSTAEYFPEPKL
jgi:hypothetical protein